MGADFKAIDAIFAAAEKDGRSSLFEHEFYGVLAAAGVRTPVFCFVPRGGTVEASDLAKFHSSEVVLKIIAPLIQHKTDVGGVAFVRTETAAVKAGIRLMEADVPGRFLSWLAEKSPEEAKRLTPEAVANDLRGVLICEKVAYDKVGFGTELLLGVRHSREFGPVVSLGAGGIEVEYLNQRLKEGQAVSMASAHLLTRDAIASHLAPLAVFDKLVKPFRGRPAPLTAEALAGTFAEFLALAAHYSPFAKGDGFVIEEAEVNPFVMTGGALVPLDGLCRFSRAHVDVHDRPVAGLGSLLKPASAAVIGVSEKVNLGRVILRNILKMGFDRSRVYVVKPGPSEIDGCRCVPTVADLPETVDLFVLTLGAEQCEGVLRDLVAHGKARSAIVIAGGMGEKQGTQSIEGRIQAILAEGRREGKTTPVVNGGNCLGIYSRPGLYDTTFIPEHKLRFPRNERPELVHISQSGAFMISRISRMDAIEPLYAVSLGNQIDLRFSDYLNYLKDEPSARVLALYVEGFKPGDGYLTAKAARDILKMPGRYVIAYKSGRTPEGRMASAGHTASVAGEYGVCRAVLEDAGVIVAGSLAEFDGFVAALPSLHGRFAAGNRVGLISNAGFECVIMSDSLKNGARLELAAFSEATKKRLAEILAPAGIDKLQDIKNPMDTTPTADDAAFGECARAILDDPAVDCAVISPVPMTRALQTLAPGQGHTESIEAPESTPSRMIAMFRATSKPVVACIDAGALYDPMAAKLAAAGMPVFRRSDEAVAFLRRLAAAQIRLRTLYGRTE
ncbi:MAG: acetate--CoA ligase family protein [Acidobacteriota bacterium]|nr:acetate--CoA ligase family protein [Acidobacteriota bacterium]